MKCSVKDCDNDLPEKPQEFNILGPDFETRRVKVCDGCYQSHTSRQTPVYIPLKEGA